jgi:hypothetical protein
MPTADETLLASARPANEPCDASIASLPRCLASIVLSHLDANSLAALTVAAPRHFRELADEETESRLRLRWRGAADAASALKGFWLTSLRILCLAAPSVADASAPPSRAVLSPPWCREVEAFAADVRRRRSASRLLHDRLAAFQRAARRGDVTASEALSFLQRGWRALAAAQGSPSASARAFRVSPLDFAPQRDAARRGHVPSLIKYGIAFSGGFATLLSREAAVDAGNAAVPAGASFVLLQLTRAEPRVAMLLLANAVGLSTQHDGTPSADALTQFGLACELQMQESLLERDAGSVYRHLLAAVAAYDAAAAAMPSAVLRLAVLLGESMPQGLLDAGVVRSLEEVPTGEAEFMQPARRGALLARLMGVRHEGSVTVQEVDTCRQAVRQSFVADAQRFAAPGALARVVPDYRALVRAQALPLVARLEAEAARRTKRQRYGDAAACVPAAAASQPRRHARDA